MNNMFVRLDDVTAALSSTHCQDSTHSEDGGRKVKADVPGEPPVFLEAEDQTKRFLIVSTHKDG